MQQYQLRVPFRLTYPLTQPTEFVADWQVGSLRIRLTNQSPDLVVTAEPFDSEATAGAFLPQVWGALACVSASLGTGFSLDRGIAELFLPATSSRLHELAVHPGLQERDPCEVFADGQRPSVIPLGKIVRMESAFAVQGGVSISAAQFLDALSRGLRRPGIANAFSDATLALAIELLGRANVDSSQHSRFLTLISALEVLFDPSIRPSVAVELVESFLAEARSRRDNSCTRGTNEWSALDDLAKGANYLKQGSKRASVRQLALKVFTEDPDPPSRAKEVVKAYDLRSTLVHTGNIRPEDLSFGLRTVTETVKRAIAARIERAVADGQQSAT